MKKNKGYTLIELLIVLAIMAAMTGVAFVTLGVMNQAKYSSAITTLENEISTFWVKTKALSQGETQTSPSGTDPKNIYPLGMLISENTDTTDNVRDGSYEVILGYYDGTTFIQKEVSTVLTNIIDIKYTAPASSSDQKHSVLTTENANGYTNSVYIQFNKSDGSVKYGAGSYEIFYNDDSVGVVYLDPVTGNHYIK